MEHQQSFAQGVRAGLPIAAAYFPVALALGAASSQLGFSPFHSALWSLTMFSGANQALLLSSVVAGTPLLVVAALCAAASLRHILYGIVLADRIPARRWTRILFGYGLTDEVFATTVGADDPHHPHSAWLIGLAATALAVWVTGTGIGSAIGDALASASPRLGAALQFALPALFFALAWSAASRGMLPRMALAGVLAACFVTLGHASLAIPAGAMAALLPSGRPS